MKTLEFRAWDKDCRRFEYFEIGENEDCYGMFRVVANKFGSVVEQYTGLKDKNGKAIYEGDIVNISDAPAVSGKALIVKFDEFYIGEYNCNKMTGWIVQVINGRWTSSLTDVISSCEIVGNVHENISQ